MKNKLFPLILVFFVCVLALSACGGGGNTDGEGDGAESEATVPAEYAGMTNPMAGDQAAATAGQEVYAQNCASCHGDTGAGDGPAAASLDPKPTNLIETVANESEDYIFWRISEGGAMEPFNSSMPAWKGVLTEDQIWQVITHMQTW